MHILLLKYYIKEEINKIINMFGGASEAKPADDTVKQIVAEIKPKAEAALNSTFTTFEAVSYKTQVVAGTNFLDKVKVDGDKYVHLKVFRPLPCNGTALELLEQSAGHSLQDQF